METSILEGAYKVSHAPAPRAEAVTFSEPGPDLPVGLGGGLWEVGSDCG